MDELVIWWGVIQWRIKRRITYNGHKNSGFCVEYRISAWSSMCCTTRWNVDTLSQLLKSPIAHMSSTINANPNDRWISTLPMPFLIVHDHTKHFYGWAQYRLGDLVRWDIMNLVLPLHMTQNYDNREHQRVRYVKVIHFWAEDHKQTDAH